MAFYTEVNTYLVQLASDLHPTAQLKTEAQKRHTLIREIFNTGEMGRRIVRTYLSGSYVRHTTITPISDIDIIVEIIPERWDISFLRTRPTPQQVINTFERSIRSRLREMGSDARVRQQNRSVGIIFENGPDVDLVPAIPENNISKSNLETLLTLDEKIYLSTSVNREIVTDWVYIPDRRQDSWVISNPRGHVRAMSAINQNANKLLKPIARLLKQWNPNTNAISSFTLETLAAYALNDTHDFENPIFLNAMLHTFAWIAQQGGLLDSSAFVSGCGVDLRTGFFNTSKILDLVNTENNLAERMDKETLQSLTKQALNAHNKLLTACRARNEINMENHLDTLFSVE